MAPDQPPQKSFWDVLVQPKKKWSLSVDKDVTGQHAKAKLTVETYDVRTVGDAKVARLRWTLLEGKTKTDVGDSAAGRYTQLAVTKSGLYVLSHDMDDAKIAEALKKKPSRSDPPKEYKGTKQNGGRYLRMEGADTACMGFEPLPGAGDCPDICEGEVCFSRYDGIASVNGAWSPVEYQMSQ
jgi:hypothetical protein